MKRFLFPGAAAWVAAVFMSSVPLQAQLPSIGDDTTTSLGQFRIVVNPAYQPLLAGYPGYDGAGRLNSPLLFDPATVIGRSNPHLDGDAADLGGTPVGTAGTVISDSSFSVVPPGFQGPAGTREIHTEVRSLNMVSGPVAVRAGTFAPGRPISPGEVESQSPSGLPANDFPAESFFDVFVEVDLPAFGLFAGSTLYNSTALLVENDNLMFLPPQVVYIHGNSSAVPILFGTDTVDWDVGDVFGILTLAGHGISFDAGNPGDVAEFNAIMQSLPEMPVEPQYLEWAPGLVQVPEPSTYAILLAFILPGLGWHCWRKNRTSVPKP